MNRIALLATSAVLGLAPFAAAQDAPANPAAPQPAVQHQPNESKEQLIALLAEAGKPEESHKVLEQLTGDFEIAGRLSMMPGLDIDWTSTGTGKTILGGRFLELDITSKPDAKPQISSKSVFGFDTRRGVYTLWGIDTLGTYSVSGTGSYDAATKKLVISGTEAEGGRTLNFRFTYTFTDAGYNAILEFEMAPNTWSTVGKWDAKRIEKK